MLCSLSYSFPDLDEPTPDRKRRMYQTYVGAGYENYYTASKDDLSQQASVA